MASEARVFRFGHAKRLLPFALLALLLAGCSTRDHTNPFDPENPDTGGHPRLLTAVAGDGRVDLEWSVDPLEDLVGFRLVRTGPDGERLLADSLAASARSWSDSSVTNETAYDYRLDVRFAGRAEPVTTPVVPATPGRRALWLLEGRDSGPVRIAPDGRTVAGRLGTYAPGRLEVDPVTGRAYVVDAGEERLESYAADGTPGPSVSFPGVLSVVAADGGDVWVAAREPGRLLRLAADLRSVVSVDTIAEAQLQELVWDAARGALWASDVLGARVIHRRSDGSRAVIEGFSLPFSLVVEPTTGDVWVADRREGSIARIDAAADTVRFRFTGFRSPLDLARDPGGNGVWVSDGTLGLLLHLDEAGTEIGRITGLDRPYGLARDPDGLGLWVTDAQRGTLERYGPDGVVEVRLSRLFSPFAVAVAHPALP